VAVPRDILVELHMHEAVFREGVELAGFRLARLEEPQRLRNRHLEDEHLARMERMFRNAMPRLDDGRVLGARGRGDSRGALEELPDRDRIRRVIGALIDDLQEIVLAENGGRHLHAARAPAIGHRHLARREGHLISGNRDRLQDRAADHPLRLLVEIREIVSRKTLILRFRHHSAASRVSIASSVAVREACCARIRRTSSSSA
jgi:hypothetical protein